MVRIGRGLKDHLVLTPPPLPWAGTPFSGPDCSEPHPTWSWTIPGMGIHHFFRQPVPMPHHQKELPAFLAAVLHEDICRARFCSDCQSEEVLLLMKGRGISCLGVGNHETAQLYEDGCATGKILES